MSGRLPFLQIAGMVVARFFILQKIILLSAFIYECVDQPRKVDVPRGLGMCHNKLFASDTYPCTACEFCVEFGTKFVIPNSKLYRTL